MSTEDIIKELERLAEYNKWHGVNFCSGYNKCIDDLKKILEERKW